jgi:hypothetical protein
MMEGMVRYPENLSVSTFSKDIFIGAQIFDSDAGRGSG